MRALWSRVRALFRGRQLDARLDEEVQVHLDELTADYERRGLSPDQARLAARRAFGGVEQIKEVFRDQRRLPWIEDLVRDVCYSVRTLVAARGFSIVAIVTLALGIGANTAAFSLLVAMRFQPLPVASPREIVQILAMNDGVWDGVSRDEFLAHRTERRSLADVGAYAHVYMGDVAEARELDIYVVSGNLFDVLGVKPALGRFFLPSEDEVPRRNPVVVLAHQFWQSRLAGAPDVIGRTVTMNGTTFTVVGVAPASLRAPVYGEAIADAWIPWMMSAVAEHAQATPFTMLGRLRSGSTVAEAQAEYDVVAARLRTGAPSSERRSFRVTAVAGRPADIPRDEPIAMSAAPPILLLGVVCLLAIACWNLAGLFLARGLNRAREIATRRALGATGSRLCRQLITESVTLSLVSAIPGLLVAQGFMRLIGRFYGVETEGTAQFLDVRLDPLVLGFAVLVSTCAGVAIGTLPAVRAMRAPLAVRQARGGTPRASAALLVGQVALCLVLMVHAGLLFRTAHGVMRDPGFDVERVVFIRMKTNVARLDSAASAAYFDEVTRRVNAVPGVESVAFAQFPPLHSWAVDEPFAAADAPDSVAGVWWNRVTPSFFATMGIPIVEGRSFDIRDATRERPPIVVNEAFARRYWPGQSAIGRNVLYRGKPYEVIGIARYTNYSKSDGSGSLFAFFPARQPGNRMFVRVSTDARQVIQGLHRTIAAANPDVPISEEMTLATLVGNSFRPVRLVATGLGFSAGMSLLLSLVGVYAALAGTIARRTHEIGIRMALGARGMDVARLVSRDGLVVIGVGVAIGLASAAASTRLVSSLLYGVSADDAVSFLVAPLLILLVGAVATALPVRRALRINPIDAVRCD